MQIAPGDTTDTRRQRLGDAEYADYARSISTAGFGKAFARGIMAIMATISPQNSLKITANFVKKKYKINTANKYE